MNETAASPGKPDYVLILGHGRSGTNWLLDILGTSPQTLCRNEPNEIAHSPLGKLPSGSAPLADPSALNQGWDAAVQWTRVRLGERDQRTFWGLKEYFYSGSRKLGLLHSMRPRARKVLRFLFPSLGLPEWEIPGWITSRQALGRALPVLKINQTPAWGAWVLANRPQAQVLHIVRHPGGFLNSWRNRYLKEQPPEKVRQENRDRLAAIARLQPEWGQRFGDIDSMSTVESELWFWRYATETIHSAGEGKPRYELIRYEELAAHPVELSRKVFKACGLNWDEGIAERIRSLSSESPSIASAWASRLAAEDLDALERVLSDSLLASWFPPIRSEPVSRGT